MHYFNFLKKIFFLKHFFLIFHPHCLLSDQSMSTFFGLIQKNNTSLVTFKFFLTRLSGIFCRRNEQFFVLFISQHSILIIFCPMKFCGQPFCDQCLTFKSIEKLPNLRNILNHFQSYFDPEWAPHMM